MTITSTLTEPSRLCGRQVHLKERMHALEEKNQLSNEVQRMRKSLEDIGNQKVNSQKQMVGIFTLLGFDEKETFSTSMQCSHLRIAKYVFY